ncbi:MAG: hypothetical protein IT331_14195 [Anaerolineae bacterium]|nr:hypothetical protein [Anaerolineae bacterium]
MGLPLLLVTLTVSAVVVHVARYWRPFAFVASVGATIVLVWSVQNASIGKFDLLGLSFTFQPLSRDYMLAAMALSGALAIATSFGETRRTLGFLFWSWIVWLVALLVDDFVVGVFAWAAGLAVMVIAMEPRRMRRVGGAAYFLVLIIIASALLLLGHRFAQLYPLTPDQISLLETSILFLAWGLGLLLAMVPFMLWLGPMADETPLPIIAVLLGLGQPIGLWLLYELIGQYPRLNELSNLTTIFQVGGISAILVGGALCALERRAARLMSFAALLALGFVFMDLGRNSLEGITNAVLEMFARALGLTLMAASITVAREIENRLLNYVAIPVFILGAMMLAGIAPGIVLATRWNLLLELEATDMRLFYLAMLATAGVLIGAARFILSWLDQLGPQPDWEEEFVPPASIPDFQMPLLARARSSARRRVSDFFARMVESLPSPLRRVFGGVSREWRTAAGILLLIVLGGFVLYFNVTPASWYARALETTQQMTFLR